MELWERLREKAAESGVSPSKLLEELIESLLPEEDDFSLDTVPPDQPDFVGNVRSLDSNVRSEDDDEKEDDDLELPNFAKRYRANFCYQNDYYSPHVNSYLLENEKLIPF